MISKGFRTHRVPQKPLHTLVTSSRWAFVLLILLWGCPAFAQGRSSQKARSVRADARPNVVFILVDDLGWKDLGVYGSTFYETPNIDRLARQGMLFTDAYAAAPICSPTRAAILTGQYSARLRITDWIPGRGGLDRNALYWHYPHYSNQGGTPASAVRHGAYKLIEFYEDGHLELYHLEGDIGETNNLAEKRPEKTQALYDLLKTWRRTVEAQVPAKRNPAYDPDSTR